MMSRYETRQLQVYSYLTTPPAIWDTMNSEFSQQYRSELLDELEALACRAAMLSGYIASRHGEGCGDQGHRDAVKEANRRLKLTRKAIGYTFPERGCFSF